MENTADTKRILGFVLCAIRNFVVERAKALCSVAVGGGAQIADREPENFSEWMFWLCLICHATEILCSHFVFFEQIDAGVPRARALPGGGGIGTSVVREAGAQSWGQGRHDQAHVGAEYSRVGIRLGLRAVSKLDDDTGRRSEEIPPVELSFPKIKRLTLYLPCCISIHCE
jgi:hypothetical protein